MTRTDLRFGSDRGVMRSEDDPLLRGVGRFTDDLAVEGAVLDALARRGIRGLDLPMSPGRAWSARDRAGRVG
jgi:hypothetical protein